MKDLFEYIKSRILTNVSAIKTVRYWNNQPEHSNQAKAPKGGYVGPGRDEKAFKYPACFIEFIFNGVDNRCLKIKDYLLAVRFRFAKEGYRFERLNTFDFVDDFDATMQLMAPTQASGLIFTTFQEAAKGTFEDDFDNVENLYLEYTTRFRYTKSYRPLSTFGPVNLEVTGSISPVTEKIFLYEPAEKQIFIYEPAEAKTFFHELSEFI